jgi:hypothetical protein
MASFTFTRIARWDFYDLWSADIANIDGNFSHDFSFPVDTEPLALCTLSFAVEAIAQMSTDYADMGVHWTGRVNNSNYKLWRRTAPFLRKVLDSMVSADLELQYPVEIRKGENILVQTKEIDSYGSPTGDATISVMTRPTWANLTQRLINTSNSKR